MKQTTAVILAAGKGTRMKSELTKVLHPLLGRPMVKHVLRAVKKAGVSRQIVVVGHQAQKVIDNLGEEYLYAVQQQQLGTGHALQQTVHLWPSGGGTLLVLCGDTPLITVETLKGFLDSHHAEQTVCSVLTAKVPDPAGYGRVVRDEQGYVTGIVEEKDATDAQKRITEINTGCYCFERTALAGALEQLTPANAQGEYYLTDAIGYFRSQGLKVTASALADFREMQGINNRSQLAAAEGVLRQRVNEQIMLEGVTMVSPQQTYIDVDVTIGSDTVILPNTRITGKTVIGRNCEIGPDTSVIDSNLGNEVTINNSVIKESNIGDNCIIGPFSYLRPGSELMDGVKIGDFVEVKKSKIGAGSKIPHLSYIGDSIIGRKVNVGAGTITCNYDGVNKWETIIKDGAFIGSNTNLVAPVEVGESSLIGAGSTITKDVPANSLAVARGKQRNMKGKGNK